MAFDSIRRELDDKDLRSNDGTTFCGDCIHSRSEGRAGTARQRRQYQRVEEQGEPGNRLGPHERAFIHARDGFYMSTISETGWPYIQYRGGPKGFLKILDDRTLGFADLGGNMQYISTGNLKLNDRVALFLMDYPHQRRLKILG